jgi:meso-butanediol dehydrogenase/(S,S)-butanediol dehydrogenase/diacetyl reductase
MLMRFDGKVAIVSGGGSGVGAASARRLASEGASVVVTGRRSDRLHAVAEEIGGVAVAGDIAEPGTVETAASRAEETFGGIDVVVANAGVGFGGGIDDLEDELWQRTFDVNVTGAMRLVRACVAAMASRGGGAAVLVSSVSGLVASPSSAAYVASKAALLGLTKSIAVDLAPQRIRANAVCPGWVRTEMGDEALQDLGRGDGRAIDLDDAYALATATIPMRRPADADEIAACVAFLASDDASYVTGATLAVDGGLLAVDPGGLAFDRRPGDPNADRRSRDANADRRDSLTDHPGGDGPAR